MTDLIKSSFTTCATAVLMVAFVPFSVSAQTPGDSALSASPAAAATFLGDTGLWYVPVAEVLPAGVYSAGVYSASEMRDQSSTKVSYAAASVATGIGNRAEVFGSWQLTTWIDGQRARGDALAGAKLNLLSQRRGAPLAMALRSVVKLPVGSESKGASTGSTDLLTELVASRQFGRAEVTSSTGIVWRGDADGADLPSGLRSGVGVAVLAHRSLRLFTEIHGERFNDDAAGARLISALDTPTTAAAGASWTFANGTSASAGISRAMGGRDDARGIGVVARFGYRPGSRRMAASVAPAPAPPAVASAPPAPPVPPTVPASAPATTAGRRMTFDDVQFDLDRDTLRPSALAILDEVVTTLSSDPSLRLQIDGHACEIGTAEYNLALSDRRANAVRNYLLSRGIANTRMETATYGEEKPKHDNRAEETRALNRRAELTVSSR